jgi:hypothetical protein
MLAIMVADDQALQLLLVSQRILDGQQTAPRLAIQDEVLAIETERASDLFDLVDESVDRPKLGIVRPIAPS